MNKVEIIEETASFYNLNNRSEEFFHCQYLNDKSDKCALGRCLTEEALKGIIASGYNSFSAFTILKSKDNTMFKPEYRLNLDDSINVYFWVDLQLLHDIANNWDKNGLTQKGLNKKQVLINRYTDK